MIIVEEKLKAIFDYLPEIAYSENSDSYKPIFGYGDKHELVSFLKAAETNNYSPYPLIWLLYPYSEEHLLRQRKVYIEELVLILAVNASKVASNTVRMETTYNRILFPLYDNIANALRRASNVNLNEEVTVVKFPNYSDDLSTGESSFTIDTWDALKTTWDLTINDACLKEIKNI